MKAQDEEKAKSGSARLTKSQTDDQPKTYGCLSKFINLAAIVRVPTQLTAAWLSLREMAAATMAATKELPLKHCEPACASRNQSFRKDSSNHHLSRTYSKRKADEFTFSCVRHAPRLVLELSSDRLALRNVVSMVSNELLASDEILISLPVLCHSEIDSRTLLERNCTKSGGKNCCKVSLPFHMQYCVFLGRLIIARLQRVHDAELHDNSISSASSPSSSLQ